MDKLALNFLQKNLLSPLKESDLIRSLNKLNEIFTVKRDRLSEYPYDRELVSAYTSLYLPTNVRKFSFVMEQLNSEVKEDLSRYSFIDMGTGPGTFVLGYLDSELKGEGNAIYGIDQSPVMLEQADKMVKACYPGRQIHWQRDVPLHEREKCFLLWGNGINETGLDYCLDVIDQLIPQYFLLIEPGTKESFIQTLQLRQKLFERGYNNLYPCLGAQESCPMEGEEKNWCHQVLKTTHDPSVERLCQLVKLDRRSMPLIAHLYTRSSLSKSEVPGKKLRLIRLLQETKHSLECEVCFPGEERGLELGRVQIPKRGLSKGDVKSLKKLSWGSALQVEIEKVLGPGYFRVQWIPQN